MSVLSRSTRSWQGDKGCRVPIYPVRNVESPVRAECGDIVGSDGFRLSGSLDDEELGEDSHRLQPDGERPKDL